MKKSKNKKIPIKKIQELRNRNIEKSKNWKIEELKKNWKISKLKDRKTELSKVKELKNQWPEKSKNWKIEKLRAPEIKKSKYWSLELKIWEIENWKMYRVNFKKSRNWKIKKFKYR